MTKYVCRYCYTIVEPIFKLGNATVNHIHCVSCGMPITSLDEQKETEDL